MQTEVLKKKIERFIIPYYYELAFYTMSVTLLLLIFTNVKFEIPHFTVRISPGRGKGKLIYFIAIIIIGLLVPIVHVFIKKKKSELDKLLIQTFSIVINTTVFLYSLGYVYNNTNDWLYVFPAWNFIYALVLPVLFHYNVINLEPAFDKEALLKEVLISSLVIVFTFYLSQYVYNLYWGITFSLCVICSTSITMLIHVDSNEVNRPKNQNITWEG